MRYHALVRVSTKDQDVAAQRNDIQDYFDRIKKKGDSLTFYEEPDSTTRKYWKKRPVLVRMLQSVKSGDIVIVFTADRLDRTGNDLSHIYNVELLDKGVRVVSICEPNLNRDTIHICCLCAQMQRTRISVTTKSGLRNKKAKMERVGTCWFGYELDETELQMHNEKAFSYGKPYKLLPNTKEQEAIQIMKDCEAEGFTYKEIADVLKHRGYTNRKGKPITKMTIWRVLRRENGIEKEELYG